MEASIAEIWGEGEEEIGWIFTWPRQPFLWEVELIDSLLLSTGRLNGSVIEYSRNWKPEEDGVFKVKSAYNVMEKLIVDDGGLSSLLEKSGKIKSGGIFLEIFSRSDTNMLESCN